MHILSPSVATVINYPPMFDSYEQQVYASVEKLKHEFEGEQYIPETELAFRNMINELNYSIYQNWGVSSAIDGYIYRTKITIWTR